MNRRFLVVAGLVALSAAALGTGALLNRHAITQINYATLGLKPSMQLRSQYPDECFAWTQPGLDGKPVSQQLWQCNGDSGLATLDPHTHILHTRVLHFKDTDRIRYTAAYAADGVQVLDGFELRDDGSKLWQAVRDPQTGLIVTTRYWFNGKLFSVETRGQAADTADTMYYHFDGTPWFHYVGKVSATFGDTMTDSNKTMSEAHLWGAHGLSLFELTATADGKTINCSVYRDDGALSYTGVWQAHFYSGGPEGPGSWGMAVSSLHVYNEGGNRVVRDCTINPDIFTATHATDYNPDGSYTEWRLNGIGKVKHVTRFSADNVQLLDEDVPEDSKLKIEYDYKMIILPEIKVDPMKEWLDQEHIHFPHVIVQ